MTAEVGILQHLLLASIPTFTAIHLRLKCLEGFTIESLLEGTSLSPT